MTPPSFPSVLPCSGLHRAKELERFRTDPACFVLLLGKKGAHGLDLSFVTHMFLMDQIWDRSLETQVICYADFRFHICMFRRMYDLLQLSCTRVPLQLCVIFSVGYFSTPE